MSIVNIREQKRKEEIKKIRSLLFQGDMVKIQELAGVSYKSVHQTLTSKHPLYSQKVIEAAWLFIKNEGRDCLLKEPK